MVLFPNITNIPCLHKIKAFELKSNVFLGSILLIRGFNKKNEGTNMGVGSS